MPMIKLRCPDCHSDFDTAKMVCPNGHSFYKEEGVLIMVKNDFKEKLNSFLPRFAEINHIENPVSLSPEEYSLLPFSKKKNAELNFRQKSLAVAKKYFHGLPQKKILEIGTWNGWLTHHLAEAGHDVTTIDHFSDDINGLKTKKYYSADWTAIQCAVEHVDFIDDKFDLIILNHCLQFFVDPLLYVETLKIKLQKNGIILLLGLPFFKNAGKKIRQIEQRKKYYLDRYKFQFFFVPTKGYLDGSDMQSLLRNGIKLKKYPGMIHTHLIAFINQSYPDIRYGIYQS